MLNLLKRRSERGDTIIEVLFATAVFSMVAVGGLGVMNRGTSASQRSLEVTLVRQQMNAQADALRYAHHAYIAGYGISGGSSSTADWNQIRSKATPYPTSSLLTSGGDCPAIPTRGFIMNARTAKYHGQGPSVIRSMSSSAPNLRPYSQVVYVGDEGDDDLSHSPGTTIESVDGIWIEAVSSSGGASGSGFIDFHIRTCWHSPGGGPPSTLGTIVRLYDPGI